MHPHPQHTYTNTGRRQSREREKKWGRGGREEDELIFLSPKSCYDSVDFLFLLCSMRYLVLLKAPIIID